MKQFGEVVKAWRESKDFTLREASVRIGVSTATLSRIEREGVPDARSLWILLRWLMGDIK